MATVDIPEDQPIEVTVGAPTFVTGVGGIDGITEARAVELDAQTLAAAKAYADESDTVPLEYVDDGDADAVAQAKAYTDTALVEATAHAKSYTDVAIAGIDFPDTGVPEATIDAKDQAVREYADAGDQSIRELIASLPAPVTNWSGITGKPTTFTPAAHTHTVSQITDMPATPTWGTLGGKPTTFTPSAHQHAASDITSGTFEVARLGTGTASASTVLYGDGEWKSAPTGGGGLTGPGRPDVPAGTGLATEIAAAPVGTLYNSTDGAGAGAWAWRKRPAGWVVVDGDTGLRRFVLSGSAFPANASYVEYRRRQDAVSFQINSTNAGAWRINAIPSGGTVGVLAAQPGFRPSSGAMAELNSDGRARLGAFLMQLPPNDGGGALQIRPFEAIAANSWVRVPLMTWLTLDDWPATLPGIAV